MSRDYASLPVTKNPGRIWRIGYRPNPWAWTDWKYANTDGRFDGRWDDPTGQYRTLYVGATAVACFFEVLAKFRPNTEVDAEMEAIESDEVDDIAFPALPAGAVSLDWVENRLIGSADLLGSYVAVTAAETIASLRGMWLKTAQEQGFVDFDAAALKESAPRQLTQLVSRALYEASITGAPAFNGLEFRSRHGDDLLLWALFEHPDDGTVSPQLTNINDEILRPEHPDLLTVMSLYGLFWMDA
ncbi:RES domain-containing protein [Mycetocola manganoxydans]|uniref:RES domain-containing protein n=1 Tax=Mycetocola manganoxydans TaxID=699879 RepID=A0A3L6ZU75_9MICO|nr:RES domain-containing protein [Mycetocola manganoxydans]RLP71359.1 RES domain-containing protein [Mycetocola manganoxydans]GHD45999.1 hypothetical protein GCM10008097_15540 [Mycetocola manganoxydans]